MRYLIIGLAMVMAALSLTVAMGMAGALEAGRPPAVDPDAWRVTVCAGVVAAFLGALQSGLLAYIGFRMGRR